MLGCSSIDIHVNRLLIRLSFHLPNIMKNGTTEPPTTKKHKGGGGFVLAGYIFLPNVSCVYGWVTYAIFVVEFWRTKLAM